MSTVSQKQDIAIIYNADHRTQRNIPSRYHGATAPLFDSHVAIITPTSADFANRKTTLQHAIRNPLKTSLDKEIISPQQSISILVIVGNKGLKKLLEAPRPLKPSDFAHFNPKAKILILSDLAEQAEIAQKIADISQRTVLALEKQPPTSIDSIESVKMCAFRAERAPRAASPNPVFFRTNSDQSEEKDSFEHLRKRLKKDGNPIKRSYS